MSASATTQKPAVSAETPKPTIASSDRGSQRAAVWVTFRTRLPMASLDS